MANTNKINNRLKERRKEIGLTMKEVADAVGVSEGTVSRWESGNIANMGRDKIYSLSKILKMTPAEIMGLDDIKVVNYTLPFILQFDYGSIDLSTIQNNPFLGAIAEQLKDADNDDYLQLVADLNIPIVGVISGENHYIKLSKEQRKIFQDYISKNPTNDKELELLRDYLTLNPEGEIALIDYMNYLKHNEKYKK